MQNGELADQGRLASLADLGLTEASDPAMERFAQRVRDLLDVPVALVSLVQSDQQVFPGMCGLPQPWADRRSTPLSHSFCQHVVEHGEPLIIEDALDVALVRDNLAVSELNVRAYAGMPLSDIDGRVLGSLCAIDVVPRSWNPDELTMLRDLADACSTELRLRLSLLDADRERERRDGLETRLTVSLDRSSRLLAISESLNSARTVAEIHAHLSNIADPSRGLVLVRLHLVDDDGAVVGSPSGVTSAVQHTARHRSPTVEHDPASGLRSVVAVPVLGSERTLAVLELGWDIPRTLDPFEQTMAAAVASYIAQTLERAQLIAHRTSVAHQLQRAMLTDLPHVPGLSTAACYLAADSAEEVGGDWYDATILPRADRAEAGRGVLAVTVGDIIGHDIAAAAVMGQVRAMLRQSSWDQPDANPSCQISSLEQACAALNVPARGTAVHSHFVRSSTVPGGWTMTWTNAGHPPPLLVDAAGAVRALEEHDLLFGYPELLDDERHDATVELEPGNMVLLYTDGITDRSGTDASSQVADLEALLSRTHGDGPQAVIDAIVARFDDASDDIVAVAIGVDH